MSNTMKLQNNSCQNATSRLHAAAYIIASILVLDSASPANANGHFCGDSWLDVSRNCGQRQPCSSTSDDECETPCHSCFGTTLCEAVVPVVTQEQDSSNGASISSPSVNVAIKLPYEDVTNNRFCASHWKSGTAQCSLDLFCGDDSPCPGDMSCHYTDCHLHDLMKIEESKRARSHHTEEIEDTQLLLESLDAEDPYRFNSCGKKWSDANEKCGQWCSGKESECPDGEGCFGNTGCYNDAGLIRNLRGKR